MFEADRYVTMSLKAVCFQVNVTFGQVPFVVFLRLHSFQSVCFCSLRRCVKSTCLHGPSLQTFLFGHVGHSLRRLQVNPSRRPGRSG